VLLYIQRFLSIFREKKEKKENKELTVKGDQNHKSHDIYSIKTTTFYKVFNFLFESLKQTHGYFF